MEYKTVRYELQQKLTCGFVFLSDGYGSHKEVRAAYKDLVSNHPSLDFRVLRIETITMVVEATMENSK